MIRVNYLDISKITTDKNILKIFKIVHKYGGVVRFVGGAVRDALKGLSGFDLDLSTDLSPDELAEACEDTGIKTVPIGLKLDTLGVLINNTLLRITSLRKKSVSEDKNTVVEFTDNWEEDASRRDLTINAVYADEFGNVFDYYNGIEDLEKGIVRFIGNPAQKIKEDHLRILRFFRFYSMFGKSEIDKKSFQACIDNKEGLKSTSIDRIREELCKIIITPNVSKAMDIMFKHNILSNWLGDSENLDNLDVLIDLEKEANVAPSPLRRLFLLYMPDATLAENMAFRLKFTRKLRDEFIQLAEAEETYQDFLDPKNRLKLIYEHGKDFCINKFLISAAYTRDISENFNKIIQDMKNAIIPVFPISGRDIVRTSVIDNSKIGAILDSLEKEWINSNFNLTRMELLAKIPNSLGEFHKSL
jgi:poly(A) polymerase